MCRSVSNNSGGWTLARNPRQFSKRDWWSQSVCQVLSVYSLVKGEVRRKMNFTYVLGFGVLRDVVNSFRSVRLRLLGRRPGGIEHEVTRGHDAAYRQNGISNCLFRVRHISSDTCLSKLEQQLPSSSSTLSTSDRSGAWISSHFRIQVRSADECMAPGRRQPRETP